MGIKTTTFLVFLVFFSFSFAQEKPNFIVIFTDDHGYADIGVNGQVSDVKTPNIDALATNGVRFTSGYITAPQCIPSRAGLLTGRYQQRFGVDHNGTIPMPLEEKLFPAYLQEAGYVTGMTGKWHLEPNHVQHEWINKNLPEIANRNSYTPSDIPRKMKMPYYPPSKGFDEYYYGPMYNILANYDLCGNAIEQRWIEETGYRLDNQTKAATIFIERNHDKPFFFYLPYYAPHVPLEATEKYLSRFPGDMPERRRYCLAMLSAIDDGVGKIKATLKSYGIEDNTVIFFISDNGAPLKIHKEDKTLAFKGGAWDGSLNTPFVGEKGMLSEGGIRVPFVMNWPAGIKKGLVYEESVISLDVAATCLSLAGVDLPKKIDGVNLIPYLTGVKKDAPHKALYWRFWDQSAIRMGNLKFLKAGNREFLFDVTTAEHETKNLIVDYPDKAMQMKKKLLDWASELHVKGISETEIRREKRWYDHYFQNK
ncbi:sulfatase [Ulvibacterium sp.]|uniref:sulfatase family protein n=1 Tax=Ulvibacterium sp. TaxID=2665914 RepID=UPI003BABA757